MQCPGDIWDQRKDISSFNSLIGRARCWVSWQTQNQIQLPWPQGSWCSQGFRSWDMSWQTGLALQVVQEMQKSQPSKPTLGAMFCWHPPQCHSMPICVQVAVQDSRLSPFVFRSVSAIHRRFVRFYPLMHNSPRLWVGAENCRTKSRDLKLFNILSYSFDLEADQRGGPASFKCNQCKCLVAWALPRWKRLRWPGVWREAPGLVSRSVLIGQPRYEQQADCAETVSSWRSHLVKCYTMLYQFGSN